MSAVVRCSVALLLATTLACGADDRAAPTAGTKSSPSPRIAEEPTAPASVIPQRSWMRASIAVHNPDGLAAIDGAVFVKTDDGRVVRIDPRTNRVVAQARLDHAPDPSNYCQGIGSDGRTLWACAVSGTSTEVVRIDPVTLDVTARAAVDKVFDQYSLQVVGGTVWVLTGDGGVLTGVDTATGRATTIDLPHRCFQLAAAPDLVYATCVVDDQVIAVDPADGSIAARVHVAGPTNLAVLGADVWVSGSEGLYRFDRRLVARASYRGLSAGPEGDLLATDAAVWVRDPDRFLVRIDPTDGAVVARYAVRSPLSGGSLLVTAGSLWTSASDDSAVLRVALPGD